MEWGIEQEKFARAAYQMHTDNDVDQVGFIVHPAIDRAGASPDGLIGSDGGLEIKCPNTTTHIKWLLAGEVPEEHRAQMYFNMACAERDWWDFASYDPRLPEHLQLFTARLQWSDAEVKQIESGVLQFLAEVDALIAQLNAIAPAPLPRSAPKTSTFEAQLEASLGVTNADIEAVMRQQAERMFDQP
jgi:hypothetical protein